MYVRVYVNKSVLTINLIKVLRKTKITWSVKVVNSYWQISGHISNWVPTFNGEIDTNIFMIQLQMTQKVQAK